MKRFFEFEDGTVLNLREVTAVLPRDSISDDDFMEDSDSGVAYTTDGRKTYLDEFEYAELIEALTGRTVEV